MTHSDRVFMVPTHRPIERTALERHVAEIEHARRTLGERIPLVIVENRSDNRPLISEVATEHPQLDIYRLDDSDLAEFQEALKRQLHPHSRAALDSISDTGVLNYGNVFNRLYLIASAMGARYLHRRDSDTYAQKNEEQLIPPLELEMSFLGEVDTQGMTCFMVGGGYTGKWSIDIDHLIHQTNREPAYRFFRTLSIEPDDFSLVFEEHIQGNSSEYIEDRLEFNSKKEPDCGNVALYDLFRYIPCSPVDYALGSDYFTIANIIELGLGRVYHNRSAVHMHTDTRYSDEAKLYSYWRGVATLIVYQHFYRNFYKTLKSINNPAKEHDKRIVAQRLASHLEEFLEVYLKNTARLDLLLQDFTQLIHMKEDAAVSRAIDTLQSELPAIKRSVTDALPSHVRLLREWRTITAAATELSCSDPSWQESWLVGKHAN